MTAFTEQVFTSGALVQRRVYDDVANTVTTFDGSGTQTAQRPLTADEITALGLRAQSVNGNTIRANVLAAQAQIQSFIAANPGGATLNGAQTIVLAKMLNGLCKLLLQDFAATTGT